jgi:hypothetical protein
MIFVSLMHLLSSSAHESAYPTLQLLMES